MSKKVIVVGGGIAGLTAGIYAQRCGFETTVLESHAIAGGNCTSWKRGGYLFEGGMHWLTGSAENTMLHKVWRAVGALSPGVAVRTDEPYLTYACGDVPIRLYRDIDATERHFLELSPGDAAEIKKLCGNVRKVRNLTMPVADLRGVRVTKKARVPFSLLTSALSAFRMMKTLSKIPRERYLNRFKHEGLRDLLRACTTEQSGITPFCFTMGILAQGDGGFPEGGSLPFVGRIAKKLQAMGGKLLCDTRVDRVAVKDGKAAGVLVRGKRLPADAVIIATDTMLAGDLFDPPLHAPWLARMRKVTKPTMATFVSLGVDADLTGYAHGLIFKLSAPVAIGAQAHEYLTVNNYAADPDFSPEGKSAITVILDGDTYDFWKQAKLDGAYAREKQALAGRVIEALAAHIPEMRGKVEVSDVATPLTYERYCGTWKGSWMTEMAPNMNMKRYPCTVEGISGVYFAGQRIMPPGGLPVALMTGRTAVQHLCRDTDTVFISEE